MHHALLLSPDDQAVTAITGVLDELSVTCERPLDGLTAAQKLSSQSFDLVLVDCENLPAAKLIFDVCRRGKDGTNPVPIAIVDGRAGLPTAFRLGAELILTKPVAKDQARTTIRTAVGRVRKDAPAQIAHETTSDGSATAAPQLSNLLDDTTNAATIPSSGVGAGASSARTFATALTSKMRSRGVDAVTASISELKPAAESSAGLGESTSVPVDASTDQAQRLDPKTDLQPGRPRNLSDDPVLAELEMAELEVPQPTAPPASASIAEKGKKAAVESTLATHAPVFSSYTEARPKPRGALVALLTLVIAAGGLYGAWTYEPGFRALAEPQVNRALALAGIAVPEPTTAAARPTPPPRPAAALAVAAPAEVTDPNQISSAATSLVTASNPTKTAATGTTAAPALAATPAPVASATAAPRSSAKIPAAPAALPKVDGGKPSATFVANNKLDRKDLGAAISAASDSPLPGENTAIILSSKGAEKRLAHSVAAKYPNRAGLAGAQSTIVLKEVVDETGKVAGVRLVEGDPTLAGAAMKAVKQWRYRPYERGGKTLPFQTVVILDFQQP